MRNVMIINSIKAALAASAADISGLTARQLMVIGDSAKVLDDTSVEADVLGIKSIVFAVGQTAGGFRTSVPIPRRAINYFNVQSYSAPQNKIINLGSGLNDANKFALTGDGEAGFLIKNLSYLHTSDSQRLNVTVIKKASETLEQFVDKAVIALNAANATQVNSIFTAAKIGTGANLGIAFTTANEHVDLYVGANGVAEGNVAIVGQAAKVSTGAGKDIVRLESDMTKHRGNHGYESLGDLWYKEPLEAKASENYNVITIGWEGESSTPTNTIKVADNTLQFAIPSGTALTAFLALFAILLGTTFTADGGAVAGKEDDTNATDNVNAEK
jgi:hypothetical protein